MKIRSKLALVFFIVLASTIILAFFVVQNRLAGFMIARSQTMIEKNGQLANGRIKHLLRRYQENSKWIASSKYISKFFQKNRSHIKIPSAKITFKLIRWYGIVDPNGKIVVSSDKSRLFQKYQAPFSLKKGFHSVCFAPLHWLDSYQEWTIPVLAPIEIEGEYKGALLLEYNLLEIKKY